MVVEKLTRVQHVKEVKLCVNWDWCFSPSVVCSCARGDSQLLESTRNITLFWYLRKYAGMLISLSTMSFGHAIASLFFFTLLYLFSHFHIYLKVANQFIKDCERKILVIGNWKLWVYTHSTFKKQILRKMNTKIWFTLHHPQGCPVFYLFLCLKYRDTSKQIVYHSQYW